MKNTLKTIVALVALSMVVACGDKRTPSSRYMPDMYESVPYNADAANGIKGQPTNLKPVSGAIARGQVPYEYPNTNSGYEAAKKDLKSPLKVSNTVSDSDIEKGKKLYSIYCISCHGKKGDGNGVLSQRDKFSGIPNYKDRDLTEGNIYHVIYYGKNLMGSHASQLTNKERWQVVSYVEQLRNDLLK